MAFAKVHSEPLTVHQGRQAIVQRPGCLGQPPVMAEEEECRSRVVMAITVHCSFKTQNGSRTEPHLPDRQGQQERSAATVLVLAAATGARSRSASRSTISSHHERWLSRATRTITCHDRSRWRGRRSGPQRYISGRCQPRVGDARGPRRLACGRATAGRHLLRRHLSSRRRLDRRRHHRRRRLLSSVGHRHGL